MGDLLVVPEFCNKEIMILNEYEVFVDGKKRMTSNNIKDVSHSISWKIDSNHYKKNLVWVGDRIVRKSILKIFSNYVFPTFFKNKVMDYIPQRPIRKLMEQHPDLKWGKFISESETESYLQWIPSKCNSIVLKIYHTTIREPLVSYLMQTIGLSKDVEEIRELFQQTTNTDSFEEQLIKKAKHLIQLDLDTLVDDMNKETEMKKNLNTQPNAGETKA